MSGAVASIEGMQCMKLAVIILNYKTAEETIGEVKRVRQLALENIQTKIIVIDNDSRDGSYEKLADEFSDSTDVIVIASSENGGYAKGNNIGLKWAIDNEYDYSLVLNSDIEFSDKNIIQKMLDAFSLNKRIAVVSPMIKAEDGYEYNPEIPRPTFKDMTFGMLGYKKKGRKIPNEDKARKRGCCVCYRPQGCCMLIDNTKLQEVDYLDENTFLYYEEYILSEKLLNKGYRCVLSLNTHVIHKHDGESTVEKSEKDSKEKKKAKRNNTRIYVKSLNYYLKKYRRFGLVQRQICCLFLRLKLAVLKR